MDQPLTSRRRRISLSAAQIKAPRRMTSLSKLFGKGTPQTPTDENARPLSVHSSSVQPTMTSAAPSMSATSPLRVSTHINVGMGMANTAPAADRRSKRFEFSNWESDLPPISNASPAKPTMLFSRMQPVKPSGLRASKKPDSLSDDDDDSPFRVGPVKRSNSAQEESKQLPALICPPSRSTPDDLFGSGLKGGITGSAPPILRHKLSRDVTMADLSSACQEAPSTPAPKHNGRLAVSHPQPTHTRVWAGPATRPVALDLADPPATRARHSSGASAGAPFLDSVLEDRSNGQFAPRMSQFSLSASEDVEMLPPPPRPHPNDATPRRHRARSIGQEFEIGSPCPRVAHDLFNGAAPTPGPSGRKRNSKGAIIGAIGPSGLSTYTPVVATQTPSSPYEMRDPMDTYGMDSDEEMGLGGDANADSPIARRLSMSPPQALSDSSSVASSLASSHASSTSLKSSLSSCHSLLHTSLKRVAEEHPAAPEHDFRTDEQFIHVKPLQAAFASSGLVSKRLKPRDSGIDVDSPPQPTLPKLPPHLPQLLLDDNRRSSCRIIKPMPGTPCKPGHFAPVPQSPASLEDDKSPLAKRQELDFAPAVLRSAPLMRHRPPRRSAPTYRRRSSGQLLQELNIERSGGSSSTGSSFDDEPMTPTRSGRNGLNSPAPLLPHASFKDSGSPSTDEGECITPVTTTFPTDVSNYAFSRPPPTTRRPPFRHRHSGSVIMTVRQHEQNKPDRFGTGFMVVRLLGQGVSSEAFAVQHMATQEISAVKRFRAPFSGPKDRIRRLEEVDILRELTINNTSPYVVQFLEAWEQSCHLYIRTELCEHGNLADFLEAAGRKCDRLDEGRVWKIATEIALGISYIHSCQILHLDIKPANVFVSQDGHLKIGDFGLATRWPRLQAFDILQGADIDSPVVDEAVGYRDWPRKPPGSGRARAKSIGLVEVTDLEREGDREYIAPEVLGGTYGKPADVFSFGLLILEVAANVVLPDNGDAWHKLRANDFSDATSELSKPLVMLIQSLAQSSPTARITIDDALRHPVLACLRERLQGPEPTLQGAVLEEDGDFQRFLEQDVLSMPEVDSMEF